MFLEPSLRVSLHAAIRLRTHLIHLGSWGEVKDICKAATGDPYSSTKGLGHFV